VDISGINGFLLAILTTANTAGTNPTLAVKLQHAQDTNLVGAIAHTGSGSGTITQVEGGADAVAETVTLTFSNATTAAVVGSVSGALGNATVGTYFSTANIKFLLTAGADAWANLDTITVALSARTYADVGGGGFTSLTTLGSMQKRAVNADKLGRFIRANFVIGGTVSPSYRVGLMALALH
jgi:hypothetical protein